MFGSKPSTAVEGDKTKPIDLASQLYQHGLIRALYRDVNSLPSYIPSRTFALALWNLASQKIGAPKNANESEQQQQQQEIGADDTPKTPKNIASLTDPEKPPTLQQIETVIKNSGLAPCLEEALITLIDEADGNFNRALKNIEDWYDSAMDRVSGWYKRHVQLILIIVGIVVAFLINADSVNIARALIQDKTLRDVIVASATEYAKDHGDSGASTKTKKTGADSNSNAANSHASDSHAADSNASGAGGGNSNASREHTTKTGNTSANSSNTNSSNTNTTTGAGGQAANTNTHQSNSNDSDANGSAGGAPTVTPSPSPDLVQQAYDKINTLGLPIGWNLGAGINKDPIRGFPRRGEGGWNILGWLLLKLFGIFLTGLAISQGAPFWFDILNKFMVIRSTVKPKEKSREEASKDKTK
jgi:hypothetical protein